MGVPKFYRWISERYPCLSEVVKEYQVPEFDNLYLDMNGIIHNCSHPNDDDPHFRITEEQIFKDIFHYIEVLFRIIHPRKVFFMAVDGVAPRAKMNQQRGRRFRSAKEAEEKIKLALLKGETLPDEKRFDSNCITPGTKFMVKLQTQLEYFVRSKITHDQTWQGVQVYLSGHQTPGEGEHKIMEFIRHQRSQPDYDPNTRHCLYGLDADLMMLALCSHEPHFALLREEVKFTRRKGDAKTAKAEETTFHLLHISLMREYIEHEFAELKSTLPFPFDLESVIDDWVLMGFLVGNDFIPHLPDLHIATNALPFLYQTYIKVLPTLDGYINEGGVINLKRFQPYLEAISSFDLEHFEEIYSDYKWLESKAKIKKMIESDMTEPAIRDIRLVPQTEEKSIQIVKDLAIRQGVLSLSDDNTSQEEDEDDQDDEEEDLFHQEFKLHKRGYYSEKFHVTPSDAQIQSIAYEYVLGIQWICHYYYNGVQSWSWYYPYHYSPYMSDLSKVCKMKLKYKLNKPFLPFQQLLAVLPAASNDCIPEAYWNLMDEKSAIGDFYPTKFSTDLNGKQQEWEAVVLIPFIDETRLLDAMETCTARLERDERSRNQHGPCQLYTHDENAPYYFKSSLPGTFPDIELCCANRTNIPLQSWSKLHYNSLTKGLLSGCHLSVYYQGFPTLYHLTHKSYFKKQGVRVFQSSSRNQNLILEILPHDGDNAQDKTSQYGACINPNETLEEVSQRLLGKSVYVNWPHMEEAKVVAISDGEVQYVLHEQVTGSRGSKHKLARKELSQSEIDEYRGDLHDIHEKCLNRRGIEIGKTNILLYAQLLLGRKYVCGKKGEITLEKQWSTTAQPFAIQSTLKDIAVKGPTFQQLKSLNELFPIDSEVFNLGIPHYGCMGKVVETKAGNATVKLDVIKEPDLVQVSKKKSQFSSYNPGWKIAGMVGISSYLLARITGSIYVFFPPQRKWNVGLSLKFTKESCGISGYTKRHENNWLYSTALASVIKNYLEMFPEVFHYLEDVLAAKSEDQLDAADMFECEDPSDKLKELSNWLKSAPCFGGRKVHESSNTLEPMVITAIDEAISDFKMKSDPSKQEVLLDVRPHFLYRPMTQQGTLIPDKNAQHQLLDRVANVRMGYTVPLGYRGTVIGIHTKGNTEQEIMLDVMFDEEFLGGLSLGGQCPARRGYKLPVCAVINLSHGERLTRKSNRPVAVVRPHHQENLSRNYNRSPMSSNVNRGRLIQSPHSAFSPTRKFSNNPRQQSPSHVTVLQRRGDGGQGFQTRNTPSKDAPQANKFSQQQEIRRGQTLSATNPADNKTSPSRRTNQSKAHIPQSNSKSSTSTSAETPAQNSASLLSLTQAAQSLPKHINQPKQTQSVTVKDTLNSSTHQNNTDTPSTSSVHTVRVPKNSTHIKSAKATQSKVKTLAIKTDVVPSENSIQTTKSGGSASQNNNNSGRNIDNSKNIEFTQGLKDALKLSAKAESVATPTSKHQLPASSPHAKAGGSNSADRDQLNKLLATLHMSSVQQNLPAQPPAIPVATQPKQFSLQAFLNSTPHPRPPMYTAPPPFYPHQPLLRPENFRPHFPVQPGSVRRGIPALHQSDQRGVTPASSSKSTSKFMKEGTEKLCEILSIGSEDGKLKDDSECAATWSIASMDDDVVHNECDREVNAEADEALKNSEEGFYPSVDEKKDYEEQSDDDNVRSTSVEGTLKDETNSSVEELLKWCKTNSMYPPIYTYCDSQQGKELVSTVQLWNGLRFQSSSRATRDEAMEEAASTALTHLNAQVPMIPLSSGGRGTYSIPGMNPGMVVPSYYVKDMSTQAVYHYPPDGVNIIPHQYVMAQNPHSMPIAIQMQRGPPPVHPTGQAPPAYLPAAGISPVNNNYMNMGPDGVMMGLYPGYLPQGRPPLIPHTYPYPPGMCPVGAPNTYATFNPRVPPPPLTHYPDGSPRINYCPPGVTQMTPPDGNAPKSSTPLFVNNNPFIPPQVMQQMAASSHHKVTATGSPKYVLSDSPSISGTLTKSTSSDAVDKSPPMNQSGKARKPKAKLAISFGAPN